MVVVSTPTSHLFWMRSRAHSQKVPRNVGAGFLGSNARQNKDLEHVSDSIFCERALGPGGKGGDLPARTKDLSLRLFAADF